MRIGLLSIAFLTACGSAKPAAKPVPHPPPNGVVAAPRPPPPPVPVDPRVPLLPEIKRGTLPNGMTYYVMAHHKPEQRASLWLAVNAGSVLEDDDQRGLAHLCEHMAFNGTKRFPKMDIVDYIEKSGMRFGADLNAYTSFDQTVYQLMVPTDKQEVMLKGLDILRDWAGDVTFDPVEVDKERPVVLEEWRLGRGGAARIRDKQFPILFAGSRYGERLPIGVPEIIKTAPRDTLYRFYKDWYQPQNMAVIAVGEFDAKQMEQLIKEKFGDLKASANPKVRKPAPVPHDQPLAVTIATDKEMTITQIGVYDKIDHRGNATEGDFRRFTVERLYHAMLNARFAELAQDPGAPFLFASSGTGSFARTADMFTRSAAAKEGRVDETITALFHEMVRVEKFGFLDSELQRARQEMISGAESSAAEWEKSPSSRIVDEITRNFFIDELMPGRTWELEHTRALLPTIALDELNHLAATWGNGAKGRVIMIGAPDSAKLPTEAQVRQLATAAMTAPVDAWKESVVSDKPLVATPPVPGKVVKTTHDDGTDSTVWTLANGVKVIVKPTAFQNDEILMTGFEPGGSSLLTDKDWPDGSVAVEIQRASGIADLDPTALKKRLSGKVVRVGVGLGELRATANGSARPADLEIAMQLLYLRLTTTRKDEKAFATWKAEQAEFLRHRLARPEAMFFEEMQAVESGNHLRYRPRTPEMVEKVDLDHSIKLYKERFADLGAFTFVFVGNIDLATLQPLVETYLGSLPSAKKHEKWRDVGVKYPVGKVTKTVKRGTEPKSFVSVIMSAPDKWSRDLSRDAQILSMVMRIRLREVLREDLGGVYGVQISSSLSRRPTQRRSLDLFFGCDPANVDKLREAAYAEIKKLAKDGTDDEHLAKVTEQLRRERETDLKTNRWWSNAIENAVYFDEDFTKATDIDATIKRVTNANVKAAAKHFFDDRNVIIGVMTPEPAKP